MSNLKTPIFYFKIFKILHYSVLIGLSFSHNIKLSINYISPMTNYVYNPNFLRYGSIECEIFLKTSLPF